MTDLVGQILGNYRIEELIGAGGMGQVFRGRHIHMDWQAAIKIMHPALANDPGFQERFRDEVRAARSLQHPHVVEIYDFGEQDGRFYLVMELVSDGSLRTLLQARTRGEGAWPLAIGLELVCQAADALAFAHTQGIVHRDIKPDNMLLLRQHMRADDPPGDHTYWLKISDFGLARLAAHEGHTTTNATMGTPAYMSPEQSRGDTLDGRSDIYALGVVLYEIVTGQLPFDVKSLNEAVFKHIYTSPTPPRHLEPRLPIALDALIMRCLAKNADHRPTNATVLASELRDLFDDPALEALYPTTSGAAPVEPTPRPPTTDRAQHGEIVPRVQVLDNNGHPAQIIELTHAGLTIGKLATNAIVLDGAGVGRTHLRVTWDGEQVAVTDLGTRGGTQLNDTALVAHTPQAWNWGDVLHIGSLALRLDRRAPRPEPSAHLHAPINGQHVAHPLQTGEYITQPTATSRITSQLQSEHFKLAIAPGHDTLNVVPGQQAFASLVLTNTGPAPERILLSVDGLPEGWAHTPAQAIPLAPNTQTTAVISVSVPRVATSRVGVYPVTIRARSQENRLESSVVRASWTVLPFSANELEVQPKRAEHPRAATYTAVVRNLGNAPMRYTLDSGDDDHALDYQLGQTELVVPSGEELHVPITVGDTQRWIGPTRRRTFSVSATPEHGEPTHDSASFVQPPRIPAWTWGIASVLLLLLLLGWGISALTASTANANALQASNASDTPLAGTPILETSDSGGRIRTATPDATKQAALTALAQGTRSALTLLTMTPMVAANTPTDTAIATSPRPINPSTGTRLNITVVVPTGAAAPTGVSGRDGTNGANGTNGSSGSSGSSNSGGTTAPTSTPTGPRLSIANQEQSEGSSGTTTFVFTVLLSEASDQTISVRYTTVDGSAIAGTDYTATSDTLTFNPGELVKLARVSVFGDRIVEANKTFIVELSNSVNATIAQATGIGTIEDDDSESGTISTDTPINTPTNTARPAPATNTPTLTATPIIPPVAVNDAFATNEDMVLNQPKPGVLVNDTDADSTQLTVAIDDKPAHGTVELNPDGSFTYTPAGNFNGTDTFTYKASDGANNSNSATVTISLQAINDPPEVSVPTNVPAVNETTLTAIKDILVSDPDASTNVMHVSLTASNGTIAANKNGGNALITNNAGILTIRGTLADINTALASVTFTSAPASDGTATITVEADDEGNSGNGGPLKAAQSIPLTINTTNKPPEFTLDPTPITIQEDANAQIRSSFAKNIRSGPATAANENNQTVTFKLAVPSNKQSLFSVLPKINPTNGDLTYTPAPNANGTVDIDVTLTDNGNPPSTSAAQTLTINITPKNDKPVAKADASSVSQGDSVNISVLANDNDDDDTLPPATAGGGLDPDSVIVTDPPSKGTTKVNSDGTVTYTPDPGKVGNDDFTYKVCDTGGGPGAPECDTAKVTMTITSTPNVAPTLAHNTGISLLKGATVLIKTINLQLQDKDNPAQNTLKYTLSALPTHGQLKKNGTTLSKEDTFTQDDIDNNRITYAHNNDATTTDSFKFNFTDGIADDSDPDVTFNMFILTSNAAPTMKNNNVLTVDEGKTKAINTATLQLTDTDNPPDAQLIFKIISPPDSNFGELQKDGKKLGTNDLFTQDDINNNRIVFVARPDKQILVNTNKSFLFTFTDGIANESSSQTFNITINSINDAPSITVPGAQTVKVNKPFAEIQGTSIADVDAGSGSLKVTISVVQGQLQLPAIASGLAFTPGYVEGAKTYTFTGSLANINTTLARIGYRSATTGLDKIIITVNDQGNTGTSGPESSIETIDVTITS